MQQPDWEPFCGRFPRRGKGPFDFAPEGPRSGPQLTSPQRGEASEASRPLSGRSGTPSVFKKIKKKFLMNKNFYYVKVNDHHAYIVNKL